MKKAFRILFTVLFFFICCYFLTALFLSFDWWIKCNKVFSFFGIFRLYFRDLWQYLFIYEWHRDYGWSFRLALGIPSAILIGVNFKRIIVWIKTKKHNSKSNRIKRLEEELEQLKKGE